MQNKPAPSMSDRVSRRKRFIRAFEARALAHRTLTEKIADVVSASSGSVWFLFLNIYIFAVWIILNSEVIPGVKPFDPYPYGFLTMVVSLEAIILSIFVLLAQNRESHIDKLRDELHLQVNLIAEEEVTKCLEMLAEMQKKMGIKKEDPELEKMLHRIDTSYIESSLQKQLDNGTIDIMRIVNGAPSKPHQSDEKPPEKK